jgi:holo-[acyl-carrier protein] synthase
MIEKFGIGIDIVDVTAFENMPYSSKRSFYEKIFLPSEIKYCLKYKNPYERFAGKFAIKEAVKKSIDENMPLLKILVYHSNSKPQVSLLGKNKKNYLFLASISHDKKLAVGVVMAEKCTNKTKSK